MIASLPMYDFPETAAANDRFWDLIRGNLGFGPERLTRGGDPWDQWRDPDLVLSQTCGLPYRARLHGKVGLVGTPDYGLAECPPGYYFSVIIARKDGSAGVSLDLAGMRLAFNETMSQSGWAAAHAYAARRGGAFQTAMATGSHHASARAVVEGRADIAFVDAVTWRHIGAAFDSVSAIGRTPPTPGLPLITAAAHDAQAVADAVSGAIEQAGEELRSLLGIRSLVRIPSSSYLAMPTPPAPPTP